jgi:hypothetical protein
MSAFGVTADIEPVAPTKLDYEAVDSFCARPIQMRREGKFGPERCIFDLTTTR